MPYIKPEKRKNIINCLEDLNLETIGDINFTITYLLHGCLKVIVMRMGKISYQDINELIGVLECAKLELYRQIAAPYEDIKKKENGPVSELDSK
jgi:hypothetical protein